MKKIKAFILPLSFICLLISAVFFIMYFSDIVQDRRDQEELKGRIEDVTDAEVSVPSEPEKNQILERYETLYHENSDLVGWVKIEGTPLDYPVMQNKEDGEFYLHRNFDKEYEYSGLPFLDKKCDITEPGTNLIIYGHNMKSDSMFSCLTGYREEKYYSEHPVIVFDTIYEKAEYQIIAVILSKVYKKTDNTFKFYQFIRVDTEEEFNNFIADMKGLALYDTGTGASYGDELLTLVTCSYHTDNGRLAVLAKKLP